MAWVVIRCSVTKLITPSTGNHMNNSLCKINVNNLFLKHSAPISGKAMRDRDYKRPPPYPYKEKTYKTFNAFFDRTTHRFDENSKIVVVEGPIAAGKTEFAKSLAEDLDMLHLSESTMDDKYINPYGFDIRTFDPKLPEACRTFDEKNFCMDPNNRKVAAFQINKYQLRYLQYVDALTHVLNTGQGVVLERSPFSDYVFLETMFKHGYISKGAQAAYYEIKNNTIRELLKPHLVIYLDVPVPGVKDRIKKRNFPHEVQSKALTDEYLSTMESVYKKMYLKEISEHAELLVYDWSEKGEVEVVVEDIERIDFDKYDKYDKKMQDWGQKKEWDWAELRALYTNEKAKLLTYFNVPIFDVPELLIDPEDAKQRNDLINATPGFKFRDGYNSETGDTGLIFKDSINHRNVFQ